MFRIILWKALSRVCCSFGAVTVRDLEIVNLRSERWSFGMLEKICSIVRVSWSRLLVDLWLTPTNIRLLRVWRQQVICLS